jgi:biotin carboxyl carrier protein
VKLRTAEYLLQASSIASIAGPSNTVPRASSNSRLRCLGKVVRVLLKPGDEVSAGQGVIVVEAMKMQNEIKSPKACRILEICVAEGENVNNNQVLAVVE